MSGTAVCKVQAAGWLLPVGTAFVLRARKRGWRKTMIHNFSGADGSFPEGGLIAGQSGTFYGTTGQGGAVDAGAVFEIMP